MKLRGIALVTESTAAAHDADDATLLNMVRAGDLDAFGLLYERHGPAARRLAHLLTESAGEADELVAESFARVLEVTRHGGGPSNAVRPYVLTAVRRGYAERISGQQAWRPAAGPSPPVEPGEPFAGPSPPVEPGEPFAGPGMEGLDATLMARAYLSLPGSWRAVLWHAEVEQAQPEDLALVLGLDRHGTVALWRQAIDGLRHACLQLYVPAAAKPDCTPVVERLGVFLRDAQSAGHTATVTEHLTSCGDCRAVYEELADIRGTLRATVAPLVLGPAADQYLSRARNDRAAGAATRPGATGREDAAGGGLASGLALPARAGRPVRRPGRPVRWARWPVRRAGRHGHISRQYRVLAAATGAALAAVAVISALAATSGNDNTPGRSHQPLAGRSSAADLQVPPNSSLSSARPAPSRTPSAAPSAVTEPAALAPLLTASIGLSGQWRPGHVVHVAFQVTNDGTGSTGDLAATITLPPSGHHRWDGQGGTTWPLAGGWTCEPAGAAVTCTHAPIAAGGHVEGMLVITALGSSACGQSVQLSVTSGAATVHAAGDIPC